MFKKTLAIVPVLLLAGCFDVDGDFQVTKNHTLEGSLTFSMTPQAYDLFGDDADFCEEPFAFTGEVYRCVDPMSFDFSEDQEPGEHGPFLIQRIDETTVSVKINLRDMTGNDLPDDLTPDMIQGMFAGHAMIIRVTGAQITEQQGGAIRDDETTVIWRIPMASLLLNDDIQPMSAIIDY